MLFSEPKIPQSLEYPHDSKLYREVSVLFSEPKIPQCAPKCALVRQNTEFQCSSASRKFLNRRVVARTANERLAFQCSSASRKFLNLVLSWCCFGRQHRFSALQRAENSSILPHLVEPLCARPFQCSSASRKFLNLVQPVRPTRVNRERFSALQRAENSSIQSKTDHSRRRRRVSVLFSEPKIPQSGRI